MSKFGALKIDISIKDKKNQNPEVSNFQEFTIFIANEQETLDPLCPNPGVKIEYMQTKKITPFLSGLQQQHVFFVMLPVAEC